MSKLSDYYADRIRKVLESVGAKGITKTELMKRMGIKNAELMDAILSDVGTKVKVQCRNGMYFIHDEMPIEVRNQLKKLMIGEVEIRPGR